MSVDQNSQSESVETEAVSKDTDNTGDTERSDKNTQFESDHQSEDKNGIADSIAEDELEITIETLRSQLETLEAELAESKDRGLRAMAEAENTRRRAENDIANARKFAIEGFAAEILTVRDSLEIARGLEISEDDSGAIAKMHEGLDLTLKQMDTAFVKFSVQEIAPQPGDKLDPDIHQAMTTQESDEIQPNHVVSVIQKGYSIHGRLLRPAMVIVAKPVSTDSESDEA